MTKFWSALRGNPISNHPQRQNDSTLGESANGINGRLSRISSISSQNATHDAKVQSLLRISRGIENVEQKLLELLCNCVPGVFEVLGDRYKRKEKESTDSECKYEFDSTKEFSQKANTIVVPQLKKRECLTIIRDWRVCFFQHQFP